MNKALTTVHSIRNVPDYVIKDDAERCRKALSQRFPTWTFRVCTFRVCPATWGFNVEVINADILFGSQLGAMMESFAEGFMASAHLWER
jgi:hypothetical protein